jgi:hypothetical protein
MDFIIDFFHGIKEELRTGGVSVFNPNGYGDFRYHSNINFNEVGLWSNETFIGAFTAFMSTCDHLSTRDILSTSLHSRDTTIL